MHITVSNLIEIAVALLGGGGVGTVISKLTRLAVAVETAANDIKTIIGDVRQVSTTTQAHETKLAVLEGRVGTLEAQHAAQQAAQLLVKP